MCRQIRDQECIFANNNFKILFIQTTKDNFGNWILNGEAQNIATNPINNVGLTWHLYHAQGNIIGLTQGFPIPSNLGSGQTTLFNLQERPTDLIGTPKFYRISFDFLS
ncbi:MAG: FxLYD domain-containing protein [Candidatus Nitrosocosmicus sp.]